MRTMPGELAGKTVLIAGASGELGVEVTRACLAEGATIVAVSRTGRTVPEPQQRLLSVACDLAVSGAAENAVHTALSQTGKLDAVLHLVGGFSGGQALEDAPEDELDRMLTINLTPAWRLFRAAVPVMRRARHGRIVAIGSRAGAGPAPRMSAYGASKAALQSMVLSLAAELEGSGITVNLIAPSTLNTEANRRRMPSVDATRWVAPSSVASLLLWLLSEAGGAVSGAVIPVYGG